MATALRPAPLGHESHKMLHLNTKKFTCRIVDQVTILVEFVSCARDGNFQTTHNHCVEHCQDSAECGTVQAVRPHRRCLHS